MLRSVLSSCARSARRPWAVAALTVATAFVTSCNKQDHPPAAVCGIVALDAGADASPDAAAALLADGAAPCVGVTGVNGGSVPPGGGSGNVTGGGDGGFTGVAGGNGVGGANGGDNGLGAGGVLGAGGSPIGAAGADLGLGGNPGTGNPVPGIGGLGI
jgi:hypothetical protein